MSKKPAVRVGRLAQKTDEFARRAADAKAESERAGMRANEGNSRIRGWVLAANTGALLVLFNGMLSQHICDWVAFRPLVWLFACGALFTFASVVAEREHNTHWRWVNSESKALSERMADQKTAFEELRDHLEKGEVDDAETALTEIETETDKLKVQIVQLNEKTSMSAYVWSGVFEIAGMFAFAAGLIWAVSDQRFVAAVCAASHN